MRSQQGHYVHTWGTFYFLVSIFLGQSWPGGTPHGAFVLPCSGPANLSQVRQELLVGLQLVDVSSMRICFFFFKAFHLTFRHGLWYMWWSAFLDSQYLLRSRFPSFSRSPQAFKRWQYPSSSLCPCACPSVEPRCFSGIKPGNGLSQAPGWTGPLWSASSANGSWRWRFH